VHLYWLRCREKGSGLLEEPLDIMDAILDFASSREGNQGAFLLVKIHQLYHVKKKLTTANQIC
jgi:hypothetical protein